MFYFVYTTISRGWAILVDIMTGLGSVPATDREFFLHYYFQTSFWCQPSLLCSEHGR